MNKLLLIMKLLLTIIRKFKQKYLKKKKSNHKNYIVFLAIIDKMNKSI